MKADLIIVWPTNCDYPLFRSFLRTNRDKFARVIISFSEVPHGDDFHMFVTETLKEDACLFAFTPVSSPGDWRNNAVNFALLMSDAEWVWFMEQDFFVLHEKFFDQVDIMSEYNDVIGIKEDERLHPCCLLMKREIIEKTSKNFGIVPNKLDHFGIIQKELEEMQDIKIDIISSSYYHHMAGLSHNYTLAHDGKNIGYHPDEFREYMRQCLNIKEVPLDMRFVRVAKQIVYS